ncbi:MAG TPA: peptidoglycan DD-metalloendopeptidase family protein [Bacteroidia bacterium]|nr:peptidoglycan DD-metalloendopeptidase family protein [Bacteroidia bacterium]
MDHNSLSKNKPRKVSIKRFVSISIILAILFAGAPFVFAQVKKKKKTVKIEKQDKSALEAKKKDLQSQIELTDQLLKETRRTKTLSLAQLVALNKKIEARENLINEINSEIVALDRQIADNNVLVVQQDTEIAQLKRDYARMIVFAYRNRDSYQRMMFIFSADNFNMAFLRMRYMQQISEGRRMQAEKIVDRQQQLNENIRSLEEQKADKKALLGSNETEKQELAIEKDDKDKTFRELQDKELSLKDDLERKKAEKSAIDKAIQELIAEEIARANAKALANSGTSTSKTNTTPTKTNTSTPPKLTLTPEAENLGNSFAGNKGSLPWPVAQGTITSHFGKQPHPVLKDVYVYNNGIDIATPADASARAVFEGEITGVTNIAGSGWLVIVRHGEYLTVYAKLEEVFVKQGDKVKTKQNIGKVSRDSDEGQSVLHFEVWQSGVGKMDPEAWLLNGGR